MSARPRPDKSKGYRDEFTEEQLAGKHVCGITGLVFDTEADYLDHESPVTDRTPREIEHLEGIEGKKTVQARSKAALERGNARKK